MDKLPEWDTSKADDPQYMMNMAKKFVVMDTLLKHDGVCTFKVSRRDVHHAHVPHLWFHARPPSPRALTCTRLCSRTQVLFAAADELHCDVLTAALASMKRKKVVGYAPEMPLLNPKDDDVEVKLLKPDFDCFA